MCVTTVNRGTEKSVLLAVGIYISSHDFAFRIDGIDLRLNRVRHVNILVIALLALRIAMRYL